MPKCYRVSAHALQAWSSSQHPPADKQVSITQTLLRHNRQSPARPLAPVDHCSPNHALQAGSAPRPPASAKQVSIAQTLLMHVQQSSHATFPVC